MFPFENPYQGSNRLKTPFAVALIVLVFILYAIVIMELGFSGALLLVLMPVCFVYVFLLFLEPRIGIYTILFMSFAISGMSRYYPTPPYGLSIDFLVPVVFGAFIAHEFKTAEWDYMPIDVFLVLGLWFLYCLIEVVNPLSPGKEAWFYASRGLSFYFFMIIPLGTLVYNKPSDMEKFIFVWLILSTIGSFWGIKQILFGVSHTEQAWLDAGAHTTHVLFGQLRAFSFYSDAGQFGASQAHSALISIIIFLNTKGYRKRVLLLFFFAISIWGMLLSGTRGALVVLAIGSFAYLILSKRFVIVLIGLILAGGGYGFLKYTSIMQSNYQIARLRTALDPNDPSLMVRKNREKVLKIYMANKPFGEGIGSSGYWGQRFRPGSFLAELGTDSHFVRVWIETGIIGLCLHILMLVYLIIRCAVILWDLPKGYERGCLVSLFCGFVGITIASYGNMVITQLPTGSLIYFSIGLILASRKWKLTVS